METNIYIYYLLFLFGAIVISLVVNKLVLSFARTLGIRNKNDVVVRWSQTSKPSLGGISLYFTFIVAVFVYAAISPATDNIFSNNELLGLLGASTLAFAIGMSDDAYNTKPLLKLFGQISCGVIFVLTGNGIDIFHKEFIDGLITILWVVSVMNSLNMLDNMDGITGTVSFFILGTCLTVFLMFTNLQGSIWPILIIAEMGALLGFLRYNVNPSKMFMGDTGSQFIALFVSFFGIKAIWNLPALYEIPSWTSVFLIMTAFTPAVADTLTVMINRTRRGVSVMQGGKDHTTHHLVYKGYSDFKVWVIFTILGLFSFIYAALLSYFVVHKHIEIAILGLVFFLTVFIPLYRNTLKYKMPKNENEE